MFKTKTLREQTVDAVDRLVTEVCDLKNDQALALGTFRDVATQLNGLNKALAEKSALCGSLIAQLKHAQEDISQQTEDNARVRDKILDIIGYGDD